MEVKHPIEGSFGSEFPAICNYRGITANCVISKLFEHCLMNKYGSYLYSNDLQFGFKKQLGCSPPLFILQQVVKYLHPEDQLFMSLQLMPVRPLIG